MQTIVDGAGLFLRGDTVRDQIKIDSRQEKTLKRWHILDPVDAEEMERNEQIFNIQHNRNPFIDYPQLADKISNF